MDFESQAVLYFFGQAEFTNKLSKFNNRYAGKIYYNQDWFLIIYFLSNTDIRL